MVPNSVNYFSAFEENLQFPVSDYLKHSQPFWLKTGNAKAIVICLHGFGATTYESRPIGEAILTKNIDVAGFLFQGHGYRDEKYARQAMGKVRSEDWLQATRKEIAHARKHYEKVFLYGQSMGGIIALIMAREGLVDGIAVTAPALKLKTGVGFLAHLLGWWNKNAYITANPPFFNECYAFTNFRALKQLHYLAINGRKNLNKIKCPIFHAHSHNDQYVSPIVATWLTNQIKSIYILKWYDESDHTMPLDKAAEHIKMDISQFFSNCIN